MTPNDPRWISRPISFVAVIKLMNITWVTWSYHVSCRRNSDVDRKKKKKKEEEERRRRRNWSNIRSCGCAGRIRRKKKKKKLKQYKILRLRRQDNKNAPQLASYWIETSSIVHTDTGVCILYGQTNGSLCNGFALCASLLTNTRFRFLYFRMNNCSVHLMLHQDKELPTVSGRPLSYDNSTDEKQNGCC